MATGKACVEGGSEETFEFICTWCKETKIVEAEKYCSNCDEHYCLVCADLHKRVPALKGHVLLDRGHINIWGIQSKITSLPNETCDRHPGKLVELFCAEHKQLCCNICVSLDHRICEGMLYIAEAAKGIDNSEELKATNEHLKQIKTDVEKKTSKQQASLKHSKCQILKQIATFRNHANEIFDALEEKITDEMDLLAKDSTSRHNAYQKACNDILIELQHLQQQLESTRYKNDSQTFINMKKCLFQIPRVNKTLEELPNQHANDELLFEIDPKLESFFGSLERLGSVTLTSSTPRSVNTSQSADAPLTLSYGSIQNQVIQSNRSQIDSQTTHAKDIGPIKVMCFEKYNIKLQCDTKRCSIEGICLMPDGSILLADHHNRAVKCLDSSDYHISDHLDMLESPFQICPTYGQEAVVTSDDNLLTFVSVQEGALTLKRSIRLSHVCYGVAYNDGRLFISDDKDKVYIHTMEGKHKRTIKVDRQCRNIFSKTRKLASSPDGTKIVVADETIGLKILDKDGDVLSTFRDPRFTGAGSVFIQINGQILVCYLNSCNIMQMNKDGTQYIGEVVKLKSHEYPTAVCVDHNRRKLIISLFENNYIRAFDIIN